MYRPEFHVSDEILQVCSPLQLGYVYGRVINTNKNESLWNDIEDLVSTLKQNMPLDQISKTPAIAKTREVYKNLGKDPSRYRPSAEALLRRIVQGKGLYQLNFVVDLINFLSLKSGYSIGGYDAGKISGSLILRKGSERDVFQAIGRGKLNIESLPVLCDDRGPMGSPTSDSLRTSISVATETVLMVFFGFDNNKRLTEWIDTAIHLLVAYSGANQAQGDILGFSRRN